MTAVSVAVLVQNADPVEQNLLTRAVEVNFASRRIARQARSMRLVDDIDDIAAAVDRLLAYDFPPFGLLERRGRPTNQQNNVVREVWSSLLRELLHPPEGGGLV